MGFHMPFYALCIIGEFVLGLTFLVTSKLVDKDATIDTKSLLKGVVERAFLTICLVNKYPHALALFGTLKLGTRLKREDKNAAEGNSFNDYYLIGNMVSVSAAIFYSNFYPAGI